MQTTNPVQERLDAPPREGDGAVCSVSFRRLLVPVDFSTATSAALEAACAMTKPVGGAVWLLHVIEPDPYLSGMEAVLLLRPDAAIAAEAHASLDELSQGLRARGVLAEALVRQGKAAVHICKVAEELQVDAIVMGCHQHGRWSRLFARSTVHEVVRRRRCSVVLLPAVGTADDALRVTDRADQPERVGAAPDAGSIPDHGMADARDRPARAPIAEGESKHRHSSWWRRFTQRRVRNSNARGTVPGHR